MISRAGSALQKLFPHQESINFIDLTHSLTILLSLRCMHLSHIFNQDKTKKIVKLIEETTHYLEDTLLQDIDSKKVRQFGANVGNAIKELLKEDDEKRSNS